MLILETGMRPGEVCQLGKTDLDLKLGSVRVRAGKAAYATRYIPLTQRTLDVLARRAANANTEWLFPCPYDSTKPVAEVRKAHSAAVRRSGITPPSGFTTYGTRLSLEWPWWESTSPH